NSRLCTVGTAGGVQRDGVSPSPARSAARVATRGWPAASVEGRVVQGFLRGWTQSLKKRRRSVECARLQRAWKRVSQGIKQISLIVFRFEPKHRLRHPFQAHARKSHII